jgi:hypothetical protein
MILGGFLAGNPGGFEGDMTALYLNLVLGIWEFRRWRIRRRNPIPKHQDRASAKLISRNLSLGLVAVAVGGVLLFVAIRWMESRPQYVDLPTLRKQLLERNQAPEFRNDIEPWLEELKQKFGERVPLTEANQFVAEKMAGIQKQIDAELQKPEARGKTVDLEKLRRDVKAGYKGSDRENTFREIDRHIDAMEAKYGRQMPLAEAEKMWQQLERDSQ